MIFSTVDNLYKRLTNLLQLPAFYENIVIVICLEFNKSYLLLV